jgi:dCTP deaminase
MQINQLPGLLADRQIKELCVQPTAIVRYDRQSDDGGVDLVERKMYSTPNTPTFEAELKSIVGGGAFTWRHADQNPDFNPMIEPFFPQQVKTRERIIYGDRMTPDETVTEKIVSYGLSSAGYDVRLGRKFKIFTNIRSALIDPLNMSDDCYVDHEGDDVIIPPHSYILGHTPEVFDIPRDVMVVCVGKSTYARAGCAVNVTPIEPGFKGQVVIEIANQTPLPMKVYADMGIAQFLFYRMSEPCETSYGDRKGKYQGQAGITTARV